MVLFYKTVGQDHNQGWALIQANHVTQIQIYLYSSAVQKSYQRGGKKEEKIIQMCFMEDLISPFLPFEVLSWLVCRLLPKAVVLDLSVGLSLPHSGWERLPVNSWWALE